MFVMILVLTYSTALGFGCCGPEPSGLRHGTVSSSWQCCSSKAGCSLQCGRFQRWSLSGTGAAMMRCPAALTPAGRSHWEERNGWRGKGDRDRQERKEDERGRMKGERQRTWIYLDLFHTFSGWVRFFSKKTSIFLVKLSYDLFMKVHIQTSYLGEIQCCLNILLLNVSTTIMWSSLKEIVFII